MTLQEAKDKFPIGTKFSPAHLSVKTVISIVTNSNFIHDEEGNIITLTDEKDIRDQTKNSKYGNHDYRRIVYSKPEQKIAEILFKPKSKIYELW